ncbi:hypothetical protein OG292_18165 [Streptomyces sp. NBC_01511]|uniref:hypothetical protein n=1 Tax=Streptomyces sp. NBC_01511 TaxID=2903889 RepID=UPI00386F4BDD
MHVSLPAVPEQIQVARRIVRKELAGLGWPPAKIAACEEIAVQLARHAISVVGVSGYYLGVTKRPGPEDAVAVRVSVTILDAPTEPVTVPPQGRPNGHAAGSSYGDTSHDSTSRDSTSYEGTSHQDTSHQDTSRLAEVLTKRCGTEVNIVAQQGSWAASATLPAEAPCLSARP